MLCKQSENPTISEKDIYSIITKLIEFPNGQICKHLVACNLLSMLDGNGFSLDEQLVKNIVDEEDEEALDILNEIVK